MQELLFPLLAGCGGYLIGSISFAVLVSRLMGLSDPRSYGSGNPGATNVLRSGSKKAALLTLLGEGSAALVGLGAFLGHLWPLFFRFKGGKGVATAAGVILGLNPWLGAATLLAWLVVVYFSRYVSLASMAAATFAPVLQVLVWGGGPVVGVLVLMGLLLVWRHEANLRKLLRGTESRLGQKAMAAPADSSKKHPHGLGPHAPGHSHHHSKKAVKK